jgi:hypothetical protein
MNLTDDDIKRVCSAFPCVVRDGALVEDIRAMFRLAMLRHSESHWRDVNQHVEDGIRRITGVRLREKSFSLDAADTIRFVMPNEVLSGLSAEPELSPAEQTWRAHKAFSR